MPSNLPAPFQQMQHPHSLSKMDATQLSQPAMGVPPAGMIVMQGGALPGSAPLQWPSQAAGATAQSNGLQGVGLGPPMPGLGGWNGAAEDGMQSNGSLQF